MGQGGGGRGEGKEAEVRLAQAVLKKLHVFYVLHGVVFTGTSIAYPCLVCGNATAATNPPFYALLFFLYMHAAADVYCVTC